MVFNFQTLYDHHIKDEVYQHYIEILKPYMNPECVFIDCGCGSGHLTKYLEMFSPHVFAFDIDPVMIDLAKLKTRLTTYHVWDMHIPWPFFGDIIVMSMDVINFTETPYIVLNQAIRALSDEGIILIDMYRGDLDLSYKEASKKPFEYTWVLTHNQNVLNHHVTSKNFDVHITQFVHHPDEIKKFMVEQGFTINEYVGHDPRKTILIFQR